MKKQLKIGSFDVNVDVLQQADNSLKVVATCNGETHEHVVTIGSADQPLPDSYDLVQAQKDLDDARDFAARMASSHARRKDLLAGLK